VDAAGRGPWAGPVVAAAVMLRRPGRLPVRVDDSKRLTPAQRARAFDAILEHSDVGLGIVPAEQIDRDNILQATLCAMTLAIEDLPEVPELVLIDGPLAPPGARAACRPIVHGDRQSYVISCASIVAKVVRDRLLTFYDRLFPQYAFDRHKGYGTPLHLRRLMAHGPSCLHRASFRPVSRISDRQGIPAPDGALVIDDQDQQLVAVEAGAA